MIPLKCSSCGGNLDVKEGDQVTVCPYCNTKQVVNIPGSDGDETPVMPTITFGKDHKRIVIIVFSIIAAISIVMFLTVGGIIKSATDGIRDGFGGNGGSGAGFGGSGESHRYISSLEIEDIDDVPVGHTVDLSVKISPEGAEYKTVTWSCDDPDVATVTPDGKFTAISVGSATVRVESDNGKSDTAFIHVVPDLSKYTVTKPTLPQTIPYNFGSISEKIRIESVDCEFVEYATDGVALSFTAKGSAVTAVKYAMFTYKIYDADNVVVESGTVTLPDLEAGDKFTTQTVKCEIENVKEGNYTLKFVSYSIG